MAINAVLRNPALADCNKGSFVMSVINAAELGLELGLGQAALVPYKGIVQCQPMYQGLMELARRSGKIKKMTAEVVHKGDEFVYEKGLSPILRHVPKGNNKEVTHAYAVATLDDDDTQFEVMTIEELNKVKASSPAARRGDSPWQTWPEEMMKKTVIKRLCKMLPKSGALERAMDLDDLAMAGKHQPPAFADMSSSTIDVEAIAGEPEGEGQIEQPKEKKPEPEKKEEKKSKGSKLKKGEVSVGPKVKEKEEEEDPEAEAAQAEGLIAEATALMEKLSPQQVQKARQTIGIDDAEELDMIDNERLGNLVHLFKVAIG
jgi:recombination protein RecT